MVRWSLWSLVGIAAVLALGSNDARGQYVSPVSSRLAKTALNDHADRPTVSPYLNLLRVDNQDFALPTYHTLVRPQLERRSESIQQQRTIRQLQSNLATLQQQVAQPDDSQRNTTGHPSQFMTFLHYFPRLTRQ